ncbi:hypothetical protein FH972_003385 [Carpinus fangiana]|uniref:Uncharacterized protein n=1 Tax=Carpinus fangiana TaxID=176857 RepID=A0A5N6QI98_9ROSI|nr:hypothetical protein FH972_003385 [Carpinus fangiana]
MSSIISPQGVVLATAMAVSGTVFLLVFRLQKSPPPTQFPGDQFPHSSQPILRSCISTEDVVDPSGDGEEYRRQHAITNKSSSSSSSSSTSPPPKLEQRRGKNRGMPANRVALYNGILRDRVVQRLAYSY